MRIAWISFGFEEYSLAHVEMLAREHEVMAAIPKSQSFDQSAVRYAKVDLYAFENPRLRQVLTQSALALKIVRRVRDFEPDVVHYQHGHLWFNFVLRGIRRYPLVLTIHDPRHHLGDFESRKTPQWIMDFGFRRADRIIVHGHSLVSVVCDSIPFPSEKVHVIPHVAIGGGDQLAGTCCDDDEEEPGCVLFFGRIWEYKGLDYLIKAEPYISAEIENLKIVIAGRGEDFGRYRNLMIHPDGDHGIYTL